MSNRARIPATLRSRPGAGRFGIGAATVGCLLAASADAQTPEGTLPPVTVDPPAQRPSRAATQPSPAQRAARAAMRRRNQQARTAPARTVAAPAETVSLPIFAQAPDANPYADPAAPYKADRLQSAKFTEPLLNTPKTVTVLTKELLDDRKLTTLADVARTTPGITIGTGEGGNAFGDRFFIRGFDARSDVFVDGIRDTSISVRENFFTEQVEILRGPGSTFAGRGVAGGAINIVTKQAGDRAFYKADLTGGLTGDQTKRVTLDVNQTVTPDFSVRMNGLYQDAGIAGRNQVFDNRWGGAIATRWVPADWLKISTSYAHTEFDMRPDFGVPLYRGTVGGRTVGTFQPVTESLGVNRDTWYGQRFRDYYQARSDLATIRLDATLGNGLTLSNATRYGLSNIDYIGSIPQSVTLTNPNPTLWTVNTGAQSRNQDNRNITNQTDLTYRFDTGPVKHTTVIGMEFTNERIWRTNYQGLTSELAGTPLLGSPSVQNVYAPFNYRTFAEPVLNRNGRTLLSADTKSAYVIETANYNDVLILTGGLRYDGFDVNVRTGNTANTVRSDNVNSNLGLTIKPAKNVALYAAMATSSNPLGAEFDAGDPAYGGLSAVSNPITDALPPEKNTAYEVGAKYELFDGRLLATAAYFETYKDKAREQGAGSTAWLATGRYKVNGFDLGLTGKITDQWSIFGGATFFDSEVERSVTANNRGRRLANLADSSFVVTSKYRLFDWLEVGGSANYRSEIWGGTFAATTFNKLPGYWRFDGVAEAKLSKNFKVSLNVLNIFDKVYYDALYRSSTPFAYIAPGRTVLLTGSVRF